MTLPKKIIGVFVAMFFFSLNVALTGYVNSSLMESIGWTSTLISSLYICAAISSLILFPMLPKITNRIGNSSLLIGLLSSSLVAIIAMVSQIGSIITALAFVIFLTNNFLIIFEMDVFLNHFTKKENTGKIRGIFYTLINATWLIAPFLASYIIDTKGFILVYLIAGAAIVGSGIVVSMFLRNHNHFKKRPVEPLRKTIQELKHNSNLKYIFSLSCLLHMFYSFSVIYVPLYLVHTIGFSWIQIGLLLLIANIPFIILGYPIGNLADRIGEQKLIITGLIIASLGIIGFTLTHQPHVLAWSILFFVNRIGISMLETTTESFTFKQIKKNDQELLGVQRDAVPLGYLLTPAIGYLVGLTTDSYIPLFWIMITLFIIATYPASRLNTNNL